MATEGWISSDERKPPHHRTMDSEKHGVGTHVLDLPIVVGYCQDEMGLLFCCHFSRDKRLSSRHEILRRHKQEKPEQASINLDSSAPKSPW